MIRTAFTNATHPAARVLLSAVSLLLLEPATAGMKEGQEAYMRGDYEAAMTEFRPLAEQGDPAAQIAVGWIFDRAKGVAHNDAEAARWYMLAAKQGCAVAQHYLGTMFAEGSGVPRDFELAEKWFRAAADQGNVGGLYGLGVLYRDGDDMKADPVAAYMWFTLATKQGGTTEVNGKQAAAARDELRSQLRDEQVKEADTAASLWRPVPSPNAPRCLFEFSETAQQR